MKAAAVYTRISQDRDGNALGVQRQEELCRALAKRKHWPVVQVYSDNDLSAYGGRRRPGYDAMCDAIRNGLIDAVIAVDQDRLTRHTRELEDLIDLCDQERVALANVSGDLDLSSSDGRLRARILGAVARQESEKKSERIRRERDQRARRGQPTGGPRPFGYEDDHMTVRESEARLIRAAADRVLAGIPLLEICREWNSRGVLTARGNEWSANSLRVVLTGPRIAGLRRHRGEVVGEAAWPPIIDRATHERLVKLARGRRRHGGPERRLLTGLLWCGRKGCGGKLLAAVNGGRPAYKCRATPGEHDGCNRLSIGAEPLEVYIAEQVLAALAGPELAAAIRAQAGRGDSAGVVEQLTSDEAALTELAEDFYVSRTITRAMFLTAKANLEARIEAARRDLASSTATSILDGLDISTDGLARTWAKQPRSWRRALLEAVIDRVVIGPYESGRARRFDPERVHIEWHGLDVDADDEAR